MTTKEKKPSTRKPRTRQAFIPGTEPESIPAVTRAMEEYVQARDERMRLTTQEVERAATLLALMHEHNLRSYETDGEIVTISTLEKVKVKRKKDAETNGDDDA